MSSADSHLSKATALRIFVPFGFGYFFSFLFRSVNAVIAPDIVSEIGVTATELGLLTSVYFLTFGLFQIPLGVLLDRFGPRRVGGILLLVGMIGSFIFGTGKSLTALVAGRALIGLGFSGALMTPYKANTIWFPKEKLARMNGYVLTFGGLGALAATAPVDAMLRFMDWRMVFFSLSIATALVSFSIFLFTPREDRLETSETFAAQLREMGGILRSRHFWRHTPIVTLSFAAHQSIQGLWAAPWLRDVANISRSAIAMHLLVVAAAMTAGFLLIGGIMSALKRRGVSEIAVAGSGLAIFLCVQVLICAGFTQATYAVWALFGFAGTSGALSYPALAEVFPARLAGRVYTSLNLILILGIFLGQYAIGVIIDLWPPAPGGGYDPAAYPAAFGTLLVLQVAAFIWFLWPIRRS